MRRREFIAGLGGTAVRPLNYALVSLAITASWPAPIEAHDIYMKLVDSAGESCCSEHDCRPARYRMTAAGVEMLVGEEWIVVPNETIQYRTLEGDTGETAGGHWCGSTRLRTILTFCAVLPPSSASSIRAESNPKQKPPLSPRLSTR
jgi:hypothetical protein